MLNFTNLKRKIILVQSVLEIKKVKFKLSREFRNIENALYRYNSCYKNFHLNLEINILITYNSFKQILRKYGRGV